MGLHPKPAEVVDEEVRYECGSHGKAGGRAITAEVTQGELTKAKSAAPAATGSGRTAISGGGRELAASSHQAGAESLPGEQIGRRSPAQNPSKNYDGCSACRFWN
jgi:hypothetical protein